MSADPAAPTSAPEGNRLFVKVIRAVIPAGAVAVEGVVHRLRERLRRRRRATAATRSHGDRSTAREDDRDSGDEGDQAAGRQGAEELHGRPFSRSCSEV